MFKKIQHNIISLLAVFAAFCLLMQITVFAKTGTVVKNTGVRHTICTSLSSQAKSYYSTNNAAYSAISKLKGGSSNCLTTVNSALFDELHDLMDETMTTSVSYSSLTTHWKKTDALNSSSNPCLFYSDVTGGTYNREHVWPKSHAAFHESGGGADPHHLRPTDYDMNSYRGNYCMGNVRGVISGYTTKTNGNGSLYRSTSANRVEVDDKVKGDVARILLYVYCRWEEPNLFMDGPDNGNKDDGEKVIESLATLLQWCEIDPVDTWEMSRNDQCENLVGNRNVFIDYPEYAWLLFGKSVPKTMTTPSGEAKKGDSGNNQGGNTSSSNNSKPNTSTTTSTNTSSGNSKPTTSTNTSSNTSANTSSNNSSNTASKPNINSSANSGTSSNVSTENSTHQNTNTNQNQTNENTITDSSESNAGGINSKPQNTGKPFDPSLLGGSSTGSDYDDSMTGIDDIFERIYSLNLWVKIAIVVFVVGTAVAVVIVVRNIKIKRKDD